MTKMHETRKYMKKEGYKGLTGLRGQKPWKRIGGKRQKFALTPWPIEERERIMFEMFWKNDEHVKTQSF